MATIQPYERLRQVGENLYCIDGDWYGNPFRRRMTVVVLKSRELLIHSAIRLEDADYAQLEALGDVRYIVVPNRFHGDEACFYRDRYPFAKIFASKTAVKVVQKQCPVDGTLPTDWPVALRGEVECIEFQGTRVLGECVLYHRASKTLITTDLVFNMQMEPGGLQKLFFKWNRIYKNFGPSRIFQKVFLNDREDARESLERILKWDFDRVIMSHGDILASGGKEAMRSSFRKLLEGPSWEARAARGKSI